MIDREKVLKGLKCCTSNSYACIDDCPYSSDIECTPHLIEDAFELVKGQSEIINEYIEKTGWIQATVDDTVSWVELTDKYEIIKSEGRIITMIEKEQKDDEE